MKLVLVESPFNALTLEGIEENKRYARAALADCLKRGEAPFASHLLYTQPGVLDDAKPEERALGIAAGLVWGMHAELTVVYTDRGISKGMLQGIDAAVKAQRTIEFRTLGNATPWVTDEP